MLKARMSGSASAASSAENLKRMEATATERPSAAKMIANKYTGFLMFTATLVPQMVPNQDSVSAPTKN